MSLQRAGRLRSECYGMQHHVHVVGVRAHEREEVLDGGVVCDIEVTDGGVFAECFFDELDDAFLEAFALFRDRTGIPER